MAFTFRLPQRWLIYLLSALIVSLSLVTVVGERGVVHLWRLRGEKYRLDEQNYRLQKENEALRDRVARIRSDNQYLEKLAREELNMVRRGEILYRFPGGETRGAARPNIIDADSQSRRSAAQKAQR